MGFKKKERIDSDRMKQMIEERLTPEELKNIFNSKDIGTYSLQKLYDDNKYNFEAMKTAPFFGEETLGIYLQIYEWLGEQGHSDSYYQLGLLYYNGEWWLETDLAKSREFHEKAAALNNADAMFELYVYYSTGQGVDQDDEKAMFWCKKSADNGNSRACYNLGAYYATGKLVETDDETAEKWYIKASGLGHGKASATLGVMYKLGDGVPQNDILSEQFFTKAEEQGFDFYLMLLMNGIKR